MSTEWLHPLPGSPPGLGWEPSPEDPHPPTPTSTMTLTHLPGVEVVHQYLSASENSKLSEGRDWSVNQCMSVKMNYS